MAEPYIGMIAIFGFNFPPRGWAYCNGGSIAPAQNGALFALLGTTYGGDGVKNFLLPNLQGRLPMHFGAGSGLSPRAIGTQAGNESTTLSLSQMPAHNHGATVQVTATLFGETAPGSTLNPLGNMLATPPAGHNIYAPPVAAANKAMASDSIQATATANISPAGSSQPVGIMPPFLALNFCIALEGIYPSRN